MFTCTEMIKGKRLKCWQIHKYFWNAAFFGCIGLFSSLMLCVLRYIDDCLEEWEFFNEVLHCSCILSCCKLLWGEFLASSKCEYQLKVKQNESYYVTMALESWICCDYSNPSFSYFIWVVTRLEVGWPMLEVRWPMLGRAPLVPS